MGCALIALTDATHGALRGDERIAHAKTYFRFLKRSAPPGREPLRNEPSAARPRRSSVPCQNRRSDTCTEENSERFTKATPNLGTRRCLQNPNKIRARPRDEPELRIPCVKRPIVPSTDIPRAQRDPSPPRNQRSHFPHFIGSPSSYDDESVPSGAVGDAGAGAVQVAITGIGAR